MKKKNAKSFRSTLGNIRAMGSAKSGTHHWWLMRVTSVALLFLALYPIFGFFIYAVYGGREAAIQWLHSPVAVTGVVLFLIVGFHHAANGLQTVIEDYVHCSCAKNVSLFLVKSVAASCAILGILASLKIFFGV